MSVPSSPGGSEDFATFLDAELDSASSDAQSHLDNGGNANNSDEHYVSQNTKKRKHYESDLDDSLRHTLSSKVVADNKCNGNIDANRCPPHPGYLHGLCIRCGFLKTLDDIIDERNVALRYIHAGLEVSNQEADRIRSNELEKILLRKKLYLVLDLDHTLLNSARFIEVTSDEDAYLQAVYMVKESISPELRKETGLYNLHSLQMWTKLRPFVHDFLKEASRLFELHLYTMGERIYAQTIAQILDPLGHLFGSRVISQGESTCRTTKDLDVLLGAESAVIILDDTEAVWPRNKDNLILMERYHFFGSSCKHFGIASASLLEAEKDESEDDGTLANTLKLLRQIHTAFFDGYYQDAKGGTQTYEGEQDVRKILRTIRSRVLAGCVLVFSRIFPTGLSSPETHPLWRLAESLGAICSNSLNASVTHVVAVDKGTDKARWAQEQNRHLVHPRWVEAALHTWRQPCEEFYSVSDAPCLTTFSKTVNKERPADPEIT
ncbi:hypothetical protein GOP47_0019508 [Adiantum capillus-veneris]|uniref:RNA polymerase II C-terminal domain phosphatase-like n=1 Tax=Adiantum capillus-veneris TaxID=13818 RepID=A0A9D4UB62_ADICA|nr:hypothetical protein GOP47_0019508 [Adiantum capillus-veneris]